MSAPDEDELCPKAPADDPSHCVHWWDGDGCCRCGAPVLTREQVRALGMEP